VFPEYLPGDEGMKRLKWKMLLVVGVVGLAVWLAFPLEEKINLGLDLQGGVHLVLQVDTAGLPEEAEKDARERALEIIRNRIDQFGVREPSIQTEGKDRIIIQLPGIGERQRAIDLIGRTALLEFKLVSPEPGKLKDALSGKPVKDYELKYLPAEEGKEPVPVLLESKASLTGAALVNAFVRFEQGGLGQPYVALEFNRKGARRFSMLTGQHVGEMLAIVLDGKVHSAPVIKQKISGGEAVITGRFTQKEAADLAIVLRAGALPAPVNIVEERSVGPSLGQDSITRGVRAAIIGACLVVGFMAIYYLYAGLVANLALFLNIVIILGVLSYFHGTLTLPGIAGIILTIGMAVDANVLIFERIREELKSGKTIRAGVAAGYQKAFLTIIDANLTTLLAALVLFWFGTGPVRGFAVTLSIGILSSMFTALVVTRLIFDLLALRRGFHGFPMLQFVGQPGFDFISKRRFAYLVSFVLIIVGLFSFFSRSGGVRKNFGVDFTGGSLQYILFEQPVLLKEVRESLNRIGFGGAVIQQDKTDKRMVIIRTYEEASDRIINGLKKDFEGNRFEASVDRVGPSIGKELAKKTLLALLVALGGICAYISWRFELRFALAAIVALFHDVLITVGAFALTGREISLPVVAALLTIVGYSLNDTIVVFDRIREDFKLMKRQSQKTIINLSINQTLSRTVITSLTTLLVVVVLYLFGGEVINNFAFALLVGIIAGTYSSVFVASPLLLEWHRKSNKDK